MQINDLYKRLQKQKNRRFIRRRDQPKNMLDSLNAKTIYLIYIVSTLILFLVVRTLWNRRWLYYYTWNMPGPISYPLIGSVLDFVKPPNGFQPIIQKYFDTYPDVFKIWMGPHLHIVTSREEDATILLAECLEKSVLYFNGECIRDGLFVAPVKIWKGRRKSINKTFNQKVLNAYTQDLAKYSTKLIEELDGSHGQGALVMLPILWRHTIYSLCGALFDINPDLLDGIDAYMDNIRRFDKLLLERVVRPWLRLDFLYRLSELGKETHRESEEMSAFMSHVMKLRTTHESPLSEDPVRSKRFLNYLLALTLRDELTQDDVLCEMHNMLIAGSETSAYTLSYALLVLGIRRDVQERVFQEMVSIFADDDRVVTAEDLARMEYTERVLKETMRIFTPAPMIPRFVHKTMKIGSQVYPAGCNVIIPLSRIHVKPDLWPNPGHFDPDRFLPGEVEKRHRGAYLPFSFGARNCVGWKIGIVSMKIMLSSIVRNFHVDTVNYRRIEDIELVYHILAFPKDECCIALTKRKK